MKWRGKLRMAASAAALPPGERAESVRSSCSAGDLVAGSFEACREPAARSDLEFRVSFAVPAIVRADLAGAPLISKMLRKRAQIARERCA